MSLTRHELSHLVAIGVDGHVVRSGAGALLDLAEDSRIRRALRPIMTVSQPVCATMASSSSGRGHVIGRLRLKVNIGHGQPLPHFGHDIHGDALSAGEASTFEPHS
jgi:hypothetical protein